jgi:hypothetical protein
MATHTFGPLTHNKEFDMHPAKILTMATMIGASALAISAPATSAPLITQPGLASAVPSAAENVQYYRRGYGYGPRYGYGPGYGYRRGPSAGAVIGGLAAGAIIGGAIAASQANAAAQQNAAYCSQRYRSYDPASGSYLNNDGNRYPCP